MSLSPEQTQLLFYEIAMSLGNSLDMRSMLKESLSTYLRKLNCSAGGILTLDRDHDDELTWEIIYSIPRNLPSSYWCTEGLQALLAPLTTTTWSEFQETLPLCQYQQDCNIHLMELPDFGFLFIIKKDIDLNPFIIKSLKPLNAKLAKACLACRQKQEADCAKEHAEQASKMKSEFLANMSHEIRTPMNGIINLTGFLYESEIDETQQLYIRTIQESSQALLRIINDILDLSKIESGKLEIDRHECPLAPLLHNLETLFRTEAENKGLTFEIQQENGTPKTLYTDSVRLQQCLTNLLNNAIKFTSQGSIILRIYLNEQKHHQTLRFAVEDTGIGIAEDQYYQIFQSFTQGDGSTTRKYGGTGLGLAITQNLAQRLGGSIQVQSTLDKGSTFTLDIPYGDLQHPIEPPKVASKNTPHPPQCQGHVLVAEDDPVNQMVIHHMLHKFGFKSTIVGHGQEALEQTQTYSYDLILMDIQMPVMNGYEATRAIRALPSDIPIIALTAHAMQEDRQRCLDAGCNDYLTKPIDKQHLLEVLQYYLSKVPS